MMELKMKSKKLFVSLLMTAVLVMGFSITAFAAASESNGSGELEEYVIPADEVDMDKWEQAIVYEEEGIETLTVQKNFDWTVPVGTFVRSTAFTKSAGSTIVVSCYVYSSINHHVGIRRPDGSMLYVNGKGQVTKTFPCEKTGIYYVYVENMGSTEVRAVGYYVR